MKKQSIILICCLFFATAATAQAQDSCQDLGCFLDADLFSSAQSAQEVYDYLITQIDWADCQAYVDCDKLWQRQPFLEKFWIPIIQYAISTTDSFCAWFAFGVYVDTVFWIPLACCCNFDNPNLRYYCYNWLYDFAYNGFMLFHYCR